MGKDTVHVAFGSDTNYFVPTYISVVSLLDHFTGGRDIHIHILTSGDYTEAQKAEMERLEASFENGRVKISVIDLGSRYSDAQIQVWYLNTSSMYRLSIPNLLSDADKCLYLDSDIIVEQDISELYDTDLEGMPVGAVKDAVLSDTHGKWYIDQLGLKDEYQYFNSGVLLMDLAMIRKEGSGDRLEAEGANSTYPYGDQDVLNKVFCGRVKYLQPKYNAHLYLIQRFPRLSREKYGSEACREAKKHPVVFHYVTGFKPWAYKGLLGANLWWSYAERQSEAFRTAFLEPFCLSHRETLRKRAAVTFRSVMTRLGLYGICWRRGMFRSAGTVPGGIGKNGMPQQTAGTASKRETAHTADPFFSIIVPVYNTSETYLNECLASLCAQTFSDIEILLVDDGSGEACAAKCDALAAEDSRIRVIHQKNAGVSAARNNGIGNARGEWILFTDADDWLEKNACEQLYARLKDTRNDMLIFSAVKENGRKQQKIEYGLGADTVYDMHDVTTKEKFYRRLMQPPYSEGGQPYGLYYCWDKAYRKSFLTENGLGFTPGIAKSEDKLFILHCLEKLGTFGFTDTVLYHYRINPDSVCKRFSATSDKDRVHLIEILRPMAARMDREMSVLKGEPYNRIEKDLDSFIFAVTADVLHLKYYHPDNPDRKTRRRDAIAFLNTEPFGKVITEIPYSVLGWSGKMKKFMLSHNMVSLYCWLK